MLAIAVAFAFAPTFAAAQGLSARFGYVRFARTGVNDWYAPKSNRQLVNLRNRSRYNWIALKAKSRKRIRKVPGVVQAKRLVFKVLGKSR